MKNVPFMYIHNLIILKKFGWNIALRVLTGEFRIVPGPHFSGGQYFQFYSETGLRGGDYSGTGSFVELGSWNLGGTWKFCCLRVLRWGV